MKNPEGGCDGWGRCAKKTICRGQSACSQFSAWRAAALSLMLLGHMSGLRAATNVDVNSTVQTYIRPLVSEDTERRYDKVAVGVIAQSDTYFFGFNDETKMSSRQPTKDSIFEIGSITKLFTALTLAKFVTQDRGIDLETDVASVIDNVKSHGITLKYLAQHTSGLPRIPSNMNPADMLDPYVDYSPSMLTSFLNDLRLENTPGEKFGYSNTGMGLLGYSLSIYAGKGYETLINEEVTSRLGMVDTGTSVPRSKLDRLVSGFNSQGDPTPLWTFTEDSALAGAGALKSTVSDLLKFIQANIDPDRSELGDAIRLSQAARLGWLTVEHKGETIYFHNGATFGAQSFIAFNIDRRVGVVILSNSAFISESGIDSRVDLAGIGILKELLEEQFRCTGNEHS